MTDSQMPREFANPIDMPFSKYFAYDDAMES